MKTIQTIALRTVFPKENIESIMEVVSATPNPDVALSILLDIYEEPVVQETAVIAEKNCTLIDYDKWTCKVKYSYETPDTKHIYVQKDVDTTLITEDNYEEFKYNTSKGHDYKSHLVTLSTIRKVVDDCYLEYWNEKPLVGQSNREINRF
jgi:hypothetical protein